jgi:hypothetical protein
VVERPCAPNRHDRCTDHDLREIDVVLGELALSTVRAQKQSADAPTIDGERNGRHRLNYDAPAFPGPHLAHSSEQRMRQRVFDQHGLLRFERRRDFRITVELDLSIVNARILCGGRDYSEELARASEDHGAVRDPERLCDAPSKNSINFWCGKFAGDFVENLHEAAIVRRLAARTRELDFRRVQGGT